MFAFEESVVLAVSNDEAGVAREAVARLKTVAEAHGDVRLHVIGKGDVVAPIPARALGLIIEMLSYMAAQQAVSVISREAELTTQQAADLLGVSRPHLVDMLERDELPFHKIGSQKRVRAAHVLAYRERRDARRRDALERMAALSQELALD